MFRAGIFQNIITLCRHSLIKSKMTRNDLREVNILSPTIYTSLNGNEIHNLVRRNLKSTWTEFQIFHGRNLVILSPEIFLFCWQKFTSPSFLSSLEAQSSSFLWHWFTLEFSTLYIAWCHLRVQILPYLVRLIRSFWKLYWYESSNR